MIRIDLRNETEAWLGDRLLCKSKQPFLDSARVLLADYDPNEILVMYRGEVECLKGRLGYAATLTVTEGHFRPRFTRWMPFSRDWVASPIEFADGEVG